MAETRILIAEDISLWRDGLRAYLDAQPNMAVLGVAQSVAETKQIAAEISPDVVIVDMALERLGGPMLARDLLADHEGLRVVMLTTCEDEHCVQAILDIGVLGVVLKRSESRELLNAVRAAAQDRVYIDALLRPQLGPVPARSLYALRSLEVLTADEQELCRLLALGHTNAEASALLGVSVRKVELQRSRIMSKLGAETRAELVSFALDAGLM